MQTVKIHVDNSEALDKINEVRRRAEDLVELSERALASLEALYALVTQGAVEVTKREDAIDERLEPKQILDRLQRLEKAVKEKWY